MWQSFLTIALAFGEGLALIASPCILPILPIILSGSLTGSKNRPIGIILGFIIVFSLVTLFTRQLLTWLHIKEAVLRDVSFILLILLGLMMLSDRLSERLSVFTSRLENVGTSWKRANNPESGLWGGLFFGALVAIIWTPCAGPILAAVIVQVVIQSTTLQSLFTVLAFAAGVSVPMLIIVFFGRGILNRIPYVRTHPNRIRKILGCIIVVSVLILLLVPPDVWERSSVPKAAENTSVNIHSENLVHALENPYKAPKIEGIAAWINSKPLTLENLSGKVVLIDFWTYSCINCIRTFSYIKDWYRKYHNQGLEIIGIHSPEFAFEQDINNVKNAVQQFNLPYPIALDNNFVTWRNFDNHYWPAHYLIDQKGKVVYVHFGEGEYEATENNIRVLLGLNKMTMPVKKIDSYDSQQTPETYFGYTRADHYQGEPPLVYDQAATYSFAGELKKNGWALEGNWLVGAEKITAQSQGAVMKINITAAKVYAVMGAPSGKALVTLFFNSQPLKTQLVDKYQLYTLISYDHSTNGLLELRADTEGLEIYTLTFGN